MLELSPSATDSMSAVEMPSPSPMAPAAMAAPASTATALAAVALSGADVAVTMALARADAPDCDPVFRGEEGGRMIGNPRSRCKEEGSLIQGVLKTWFFINKDLKFLDCWVAKNNLPRGAQQN